MVSVKIKPLHFQSLIKMVAVVCFISYQKIRLFLQKTIVDRLLNQLYCMGRGACDMSGDRKTRSVCNCHDLSAFPAFRIADKTTPFFAGLKLPSMNVSRISIFPRSCRSSASSFRMRRKAPCSTHCWNRLWHVWYGGYRCGKSFQGAPVRRIHNTPSKTSRGSRQGRPRPSERARGFGRSDSMKVHCDSVRSTQSPCVGGGVVRTKGKRPKFN